MLQSLESFLFHRMGENDEETTENTVKKSLMISTEN